MARIWSGFLEWVFEAARRTSGMRALAKHAELPCGLLGENSALNLQLSVLRLAPWIQGN